MSHSLHLPSTYYKTLRGHRSLLQKIHPIRSFNSKQSPSIQTHLITHNITSHNLSSLSKFTMNTHNNTLTIYDDFTYAQIKFTKIHTVNPLNLTESIDQIIKINDNSQNYRNQNQLFIHLSQSHQQISSVFQNNREEILIPDLQSDNMRSGLVQESIKQLFTLKQQSEVIIVSVLGVQNQQLKDLLDFSHQHQKIKIVKIKNEISTTNLTQMIIKNYQSMMELLKMSKTMRSGNTGGFVYKFQLVKLQESQVSTRKIDSIIQTVTFLKLFSSHPKYVNQIGFILNELTNKTEEESKKISGLRSSKLALFINQSLNHHTKIKVIVQINPQKQSLKSVINLVSFCKNIHRKVTLQKNYLSNQIVTNQLSKSISNHQQNEQQKVLNIFPRLQSLMVETLSSVCKKKRWQSQIKSLTKMESPQKTVEAKKRNLRKIYQII